MNQSPAQEDLLGRDLDEWKKIQEKYNDREQNPSLFPIIEQIDDEKERILGYNVLFPLGEDHLDVQFDLTTRRWTISSFPFNDDELRSQMVSLFDDLGQIQCLTVDEQIQLIVERLNVYSRENAETRNTVKSFERDETNQYSSEENREKADTHRLIDDSLIVESKRLIADEEDESSKDLPDFNFHSLLNSSRSKYSSLYPPPVAPRRSRQNSACSTQSSVRYASFFPPPTAPIRRKRVVESILLHVQKKKKPFDKLFDVFKTTQPITMYQLGIEFLRLYDGKFNYREGHTFVLSFGKKTWNLTIDKIKCVECQVGEREPRSVLLLDYKGQLTRVHV